MSEWDRKVAEWDKGRARKAELRQRGWKSTGDVPFMLASEFDRLSGFFESHMRAFVDEIIGSESAEYVQANLEKIGKQTFISPDFIDKVRSWIVSHYKIPARTLPLR